MAHMNAAEDTRTLRNPLDMLILAVAGHFGSKSKEVERFLKFAVVGAIGAVVDFGTLFVLQATVLPPSSTFMVALATTIAFLAAIVSNFTWNRLWTYPDSRSRSVRRQLAMFTFISVIGWLGRTTWISLAYQPLGTFLMPHLLPLIHLARPTYMPSDHAEAKLGTFAAMIVGVIVVMFWNFLANRLWTYNDIE
jgi:putative flippase GtrA